MDDDVTGSGSSRGRSAGITGTDLDWTPATTEMVFNAFLKTLFRDPPSRSEIVNLTKVMERFAALRPTSPPTTTQPTMLSFDHPDTPDLLAVGVGGLWAFIFILILSSCGWCRRAHHSPVHPDLLPFHTVRNLTLLVLALVQLAACGEAGMRFTHSQTAHVLLIPSACIAILNTVLALSFYTCVEAWTTHGLVGVSTGFWACGSGVGVVRAWMGVERGIPLLLVYPILSLTSLGLQVFLLLVDVSTFLCWKYRYTHSQVLSITPTVEDTVKMGVGGVVGEVVAGRGGRRDMNGVGVGDKDVTVGEGVGVGDRGVDGQGMGAIDGGSKGVTKTGDPMAPKDKVNKGPGEGVVDEGTGVDVTGIATSVMGVTVGVDKNHEDPDTGGSGPKASVNMKDTTYKDSTKAPDTNNTAAPDPSAGVGPDPSAGVGRGARYLHARAPLLSRATFSWFLHVLRLGWARPLEFSDFARLPQEEEARTQYERFLRQYNQAKLTTIEETVTGAGTEVGLWGVFWRTYWRGVCAGGIFKLLGDSVNVVAPLAIALVVSYVTAYQEGSLARDGVVVEQQYYVGWREAGSNGWVVASVALVAALLQSTFSQCSTHLVGMEGVRVRAALQAMVYCKVLRLPSSTPLQEPGDQKQGQLGHDAGTVINLCAEDAENIMTFFTHCHYLWAIPFKVGVIMTLLWVQLGLSAVLGALVGILLLTPLQFLLCTNIAAVNKNFLTVNDERVRQTHELVTGMKLVKIHAWEDVFVRKIVGVRERELALLRRDSILRALMTFLTQGAGVVISAVTFGLYWQVEGRALEPSRVFSGLALFNQLTVPLFILPIIVSHTIRAKSSTKRLQEFFSSHEVEGDRIPLTPITTLTPLTTQTLLKTRTADREGRKGKTPGGGGGGGGGGQEENERGRKEEERRGSRRDIKEDDEEKLLEEVNLARLSRVTEESRPTSTCSVISSTKSNNLTTVRDEEDEDDDEKEEEEEEEEEEERGEEDREREGGKEMFRERRRKVEEGEKKRELGDKTTERRGEERREEGKGEGEEIKDVVVSIEGGTFTWPHLPRSPVLQDITTRLPRGGLTVVVGGVGSGKSSLLLALLGEMTTLAGRQRWPGESCLAYVSQRPWLTNTSLKENILFGRRYLARRYRRVLSACALHPDVAILPQGDQSVIGERGINLSGGQRQRVAVARALYSNAATVIMDCPFSALDVGVAGQVWEGGVLRLLLARGRSVIMATHLAHLTTHADQIIYLEKGRIVIQGSPAEVSQASPTLWRTWEAKGASPLAASTAQERTEARGHTARERWTLLRLVTRMSIQKRGSTRGSKEESFNQEEGARGESERDETDYHSRVIRQYSINKHVHHNALLPGDECDYLPPALTPPLPRHSFLHASLSTASTTSSKLQLFRIKSSAPAFGRKSSRLLRPKQVPRHAKSLPPQPRPPLPRSRHSPTFATGGGTMLHRLFSSASFRSTNKRVGSAGQTEKWRLSRILSNSTVLGDHLQEDLELEEEVPLEEEVEEDGRLLEQEERERGKTSRWNYVVYLRACGVAFGLGYLFCAIVGQGTNVVLDYWLGRWSGAASGWNRTDNGTSLAYPHLARGTGGATTRQMEEEDPEYQNFVKQIMREYYMPYLLISGVSILLSLSTNVLGQEAAGRGRQQLHKRMLEAAVHCPIRFFDATPAGRIMNRFTTDTAMIDKELARAVTHLMFFMLLVTSAVVVNAVVTPAFLIAALPIFFAYYMVQRFFRCSSRELKRLESLSRSPVYSHVSESVGGAVVVRAHSHQRRFTDVFLHRLDTNLSAFILLQAGNRWLGICLDYIGGFIVFFATSATLLWSTILEEVDESGEREGRLTPSMVGLAINYTLLVPVYLNWVVRFLADTEMCLGAVERVQQYASLPTEEEEEQLGEEEMMMKRKKRCNGTLNKGKGEVCVEQYRRRGSSMAVGGRDRWPQPSLPPGWPLEGMVEFKGVSLSHHPPSLPPVLSNINLTIAAGEKVGVCGRSGSGKSSLLLSLSRLVPVVSGSILIDGTDIASLPLPILRSAIATTPQDVHLFSGTLRFNLDPSGEAGDQDVWTALEVAQLHPLVSSLPAGLESEVGVGGVRLSAGQRQLVCIARSLLLCPAPSLLLLDEASSALDPPTHARLHQALAAHRPHATVITVAHSIDSLLEYPRVLVLENGQLVEDGPPLELAKRENGVFARMLRDDKENRCT